MKYNSNTLDDEKGFFFGCCCFFVKRFKVNMDSDQNLTVHDQ